MLVLRGEGDKHERNPKWEKMSGWANVAVFLKWKDNLKKKKPTLCMCNVNQNKSRLTRREGVGEGRTGSLGLADVNYYIENG